MVARNEKNPKTSLALNPRGRMSRSRYMICEISWDVSRSMTIFTNHNQRKMKVPKYVHCLFTIISQSVVCLQLIYKLLFVKTNYTGIFSFKYV